MLSRCLRSKLPRLFQNAILLPRFSTAVTANNSLDFSDYTRIVRRNLRTDEFEYTIEDEANKASFTVSEDATIADLRQALQGQSADIKAIQILSIDLAEIANVTKLADLGNEPHYIILNNKEVCKVLIPELSAADKMEEAYRRREENCENIGLPFIERKIILNYIKRVDGLNTDRLGKPLFADTDVFEGKIDKKVILKNLLDGIINSKNQQTNNEEQLVHYYNEQKVKLDNLKVQHDEIDRRAHLATKWRMSLALFALLGQFSFVGIGTYVVYSWDIMEPLAYFLNLLGSIGISALYFSTYNDYSNLGFLKYMKEKQLLRLYKKYNFPIAEFRGLEETVSTLEKKIKSNVLINL